MRSLQENYVVAGNSASSINGPSINSGYMLAVSAQVIQTGSSTGAVKFQASNDPVGVPGNPSNWTDISGATVTVGAAGSFLIPKFEICYQWIRAVYTATNGSAGTVTILIKGLGF